MGVARGRPWGWEIGWAGAKVVSAVGDSEAQGRRMLRHYGRTVGIEGSKAGKEMQVPVCVRGSKGSGSTTLGIQPSTPPGEAQPMSPCLTPAFHNQTVCPTRFHANHGTLSGHNPSLPVWESTPPHHRHAVHSKSRFFLSGGFAFCLGNAIKWGTGILFLSFSKGSFLSSLALESWGTFPSFLPFKVLGVRAFFQFFLPWVQHIPSSTTELREYVKERDSET